MFTLTLILDSSKLIGNRCFHGILCFETTCWTCLNFNFKNTCLSVKRKRHSFLILNKLAVADACFYPAAAVLADSVPCRSSYTCEPLSAPLVTGSEHLRRCSVGKPQQDVMSHSNKKCWHAYFSLTSSVKKKQPFSTKLYLVVFLVFLKQSYFYECRISFGKISSF